MKFKNYSELLQYIDNSTDIKYIVEYKDFAVVKINDEYWYFEQGENDCDEFYKVEIIAELNYSLGNDLLVNGENMHELFDCACCGETDVDENGNIKYLWFKEI